jgi:hypothetical protein
VPRQEAARGCATAGRGPEELVAHGRTTSGDVSREPRTVIVRADQRSARTDSRIHATVSSAPRKPCTRVIMPVRATRRSAWGRRSRGRGSAAAGSRRR